MLLWKNREHTSSPEDARAWVEADGAGIWWIYKTEDGALVVPDLILLTDEGFVDVDKAQEWVEENVPAPAPEMPC